MRNIELKLRHPDLPRARAAARALGARRAWKRPQRDTYFTVPGARLKVREMPGQAELILYDRADDTAARPSTYTILPLRDPAAARALLGDLWPAGGVVEKTRELWLWRNVRIHLDTVRSLGTFVELEGVLGPATDEAATRVSVAEVVGALSLDACVAVAQSYRDLVAPA